MKMLRRYLFPLLLGLFIYVSIRVVTDLPGGEQFWERSRWQNAVEILGVVLMSYAMDAVLRFILARFNQKKEAFRLSLIILEFITLVAVALVLNNAAIFGIHYLADDPISIADVAIANVIVLLYVLLYYSIVRGNRLLKSFIDQKVEIERLKSEGLQTELKFLKAQYHPHFLFNALNTIYFQVDDDVPGAKKTIERFSDLLRYQLYDQQLPVPVSKELNHLKNYIALQQERASGKLSLQVAIDPGLVEDKIYPLLLLPIVENAFKYIGGNYQLKIEALKDTGKIVLRVENSLPDIPTIKIEQGIGLENLKRRLDLLYPSKHELQIVKNQSSFRATLILEIIK